MGWGAGIHVNPCTCDHLQISSAVAELFRPYTLIDISAAMALRVPVTEREVEIVRRLKTALHLPTTQIALAMDRNKSTIDSMLRSSWQLRKRGRHVALSKREVSQLVTTTKSLIKSAKGRREITLKTIKARCKCKAGDGTIRRALHAQGIWFRRMRQKPILTAADVRARMQFARMFRNKSKAWWIRNIHLHIDLKNFPVYPSAQARAMAAQREVRGVYRTSGDGLGEGYVVAPKHLRYNTGMKSAKVS